MGRVASQSLLLACVVACACADSDGTDAAPPDANADSRFLRQSATQIVDGDGTPVRLRGINLGGHLMWEGWIWGGTINLLDSGKNAETNIVAALTQLVGDSDLQAFREAIYARYVEEADIARIAALGYNAVRIPFNHRLLEEDSAPYQYRAAGFVVLDKLLDWCAKHRVYAVLDMHAAPGGQSDLFVTDPDGTNLWESNDNVKRTIALWRAIAERYKDRAWLAGYDLLNEPQVFDGQQLVNVYASIIAAIREVDPKHMVFLEGNWSAVIFDPFKTKADANMAYSFHQYRISGRDLNADLASYVALAQQQQVPLWAGEYGEDSADWVEMTTESYASTPEVAGWTLWTWKRSGTGNPVPEQLSPPEAWRKVISWITNPGGATQPTSDETRDAMAAFLDAVKLDACREDPAFVSKTQ